MTIRKVNILSVALATILLAGPTTRSAVGFQGVNDLKTMRYRNPAHADILIEGVARELSQAAFRESVLIMRVQDVKPPHKVMVVFTLRDRLAEPDLRRISEAVRATAGSGFNYYFVRFLIDGQNFSGHWAEADHKPDLAVKISGMTGEDWGAFVARTKAYRPGTGETVLAAALIGGYLARQVLLVSRGATVTERVIEATSGKIATEKPLAKRGGRYWLVDDRSKANYRIGRGSLELHDKDGLIRAYNRLK